MKLAASFTNKFISKVIIKENLKRFWGTGALYFLALLFTGPIFIFMINKDNPNRVNFVIEKFLNIHDNGLELIYAIVIPIILATLIFRYLQQKNSSGMVHAFPFNRTILLNSHILAGIIIIILTVFINLLIMFFTYTNLYTGSEIVITDLYRWFFVTLLISITVFLMTVFTGMISGVSVIQATLSLIFLFLPLGLTALILLILEKMLFGFVADNTILENFAMNFMPVTNGFHDGVLNPLLIWYLLLILILFFASRFLYLKRDLENATDPIAFKVLKPLFKYGVTFCTMILGGLYFSGVTKDNQLWLYLGFFIGAFFGYIIAEMIVQKSVWVFRNLKGLIPFIIIAGLLLTVIELDLVGYEKHLPNLEKVESAYFGYHINKMVLKDDSRLFYEKDNLAAIKELHRLIIKNKNSLDQTSRINPLNRRTIAIGYKYTNGDTLLRKYTVPNKLIEDNPNLKKIYESEEYKIINNNIFKLDPNKVEYIDINARHVNRGLKLTNKEDINELISALKKDILNESYKEMTSNKEAWANIRIYYTEPNEKNNETLYNRMNLKKTYKNLEDWLKKKGYYLNSRILPEDIDYAVIARLKNPKDNNRISDRIYKETRNIENVLPELIEGEKITVTDKEQIEKLLRTYESSSLEDKKFVVIFYLENSQRIIGWYSDESFSKLQID